MPDITVTCGCSRIMRADPLRGSHAYACGCGNRVRITVAAPPVLCVALDISGTRCPVRPVRESAEFRLPLCKSHLDAFMALLDLIEQGEKAQKVINTAFEIEYNELKLLRPSQEELEREYQERQQRSVIYYVRIRDTIKIGYTSNMNSRMTSGLMPDEIMAMEPGGRDLEKLRHSEFAHLKIRGERFRPGDDLLAHIEMLRKHFGRPVRKKVPYGPVTYEWEPL